MSLRRSERQLSAPLQLTLEELCREAEEILRRPRKTQFTQEVCCEQCGYAACECCIICNQVHWECVCVPVWNPLGARADEAETESETETDEPMPEIGLLPVTQFELCSFKGCEAKLPHFHVEQVKQEPPADDPTHAQCGTCLFGPIIGEHTKDAKCHLDKTTPVPGCDCEQCYYREYTGNTDSL